MIVDNKLRLGDMGERIVANYLNEKNCKVKLSTDPYDSKKDIEEPKHSIDYDTPITPETPQEDEENCDSCTI